MQTQTTTNTLDPVEKMLKVYILHKINDPNELIFSENEHGLLLEHLAKIRPAEDESIEYSLTIEMMSETELKATPFIDNPEEEEKEVAL